MSTNQTKPTQRSVSGIQIACFDLCHEIGLEIIARGQRITADAVHFPATHTTVRANLERLTQFADRALVALDAAKDEWRKEHGRN